MAAVPGLTSGFKFQPDDEEVIEFFLVPRLRGQPLPFDGVVIDDDPWSAPPWELFSRNGRKQANEAYFFAPGDSTKNRKVRACGAGVGTWVAQKLEKTGKLRIGEETFEWQKYRLNFHCGKGKSGSVGWVMLEYSLLVPDCASLKVCHISFTGHGQKRKRVPDGYDDCDSAATHHQLLAAAAPSSTTHDCHQEHFLMQPQAYNNDAAPDQFVDQEMLPMVDLGSFGSPGFPCTAPAMDQGMMWLQVDQETHQAPLATTTHQFVDQESLPMADLGSLGFSGFSSCSSTAPAMEHGMMPLWVDQEACVPEQSVEYRGTEPPLMNHDFNFNDPELGPILESMADFATAAQADAGFGDHWWATACPDYDLDPHVLPEQSFSTQHQVL